MQGESRTVGIPTVFVRLTGCPLRCGYCDTRYAFQGGTWMRLGEVLDEVSRHAVRHVTVTGGEPLAQPDCLELLKQLCDAGYHVSLETSGALDVSQVDARVIKVMDLKTPGSGEQDKNLYANIAFLQPDDQVKFVICDRADYEWAMEALVKFSLPDNCEILFSPSHGTQNARALAEWIIEDRLPVRFQLQLHKILWGEEPGH